MHEAIFSLLHGQWAFDPSLHKTILGCFVRWAMPPAEPTVFKQTAQFRTWLDGSENRGLPVCRGVECKKLAFKNSHSEIRNKQGNIGYEATNVLRMTSKKMTKTITVSGLVEPKVRLDISIRKKNKKWNLALVLRNQKGREIATENGKAVCVRMRPRMCVMSSRRSGMRVGRSISRYVWLIITNTLALRSTVGLSEEYSSQSFGRLWNR